MRNEIDVPNVNEWKRSREINQQNFRHTNIKNNNKSKGKASYNISKFVKTLAIGGTIFVLAAGGAKLAGGRDTAEPVGVVTEVEQDNTIAVTQVKEATYTVDYKVQSGDTLDGIIYKYAENANEMQSIKNNVIRYNGLNEYGSLQMGQILTLFNVPESMVDEMNTGYDESYVMNDEKSQTLNETIADLNLLLPNAAGGSLLDTVNKELSVYNSTTNASTRQYLASQMTEQIRQIQKYELKNIDTEENVQEEETGRSR